MRSSNVSGANLPTSSRCPGDSIWKQPRVRVDCDQREGRRVVEGHLGLVVDVDVVAVDPRDLVDGVGHRRLHPDAEHVELEQAEVLDVVLVELAHREAQPARLDRRAVEQRGVGQQHPARVQRDVARQPVEPLDQPEQQVELRRCRAARPAARAARAARACTSRARMCGNALAIVSISPGRQAERGADVADRVPHPVGVHHRDAGDPLAAEALEDPLVDLGAAGRLDVDVDVGQRLAQRREEALHQQPVAQRVDAGDAEQVVDQAAGAGAARGDPHPHVADQVDDVGDGEEVGRVAERLDDVAARRRAGAAPRRWPASPAGRARPRSAPGAAPARRPPCRPGRRRAGRRRSEDVELGEVHLADAEVGARVDGAPVGHPPGRGEQPAARPAGRARPRRRPRRRPRAISLPDLR